MDYSRQQTLDLKTYDSILVVGVGGIGSWVALDLALSGCVSHIGVCDPDELEESNLNRTPYRVDQIGELKAWAIKDLIEERRDDVVVTPITDFVQLAGPPVAMHTHVIDCTDGLSTKEWAKARDLQMYLKLGYNGFQVTIDPTLEIPWGSSTGYSVVPSLIATPQFIASVVVGHIVNGDTFQDMDVISFSMLNALKMIETQIELKEAEERDTIIHTEDPTELEE